MKNKSDSMYLVEEFGTMTVINQNTVSVRMFPYGSLVKNGNKRTITPETASAFHLPHFNPPMKLGSHAQDAPGGGLIKGLEVKQDGLYATIETTAKGMKVLADRDYAYHSPEVIWENGWLEHPSTGDKINGPLIVGVALLHTPHLGEAAALYTIEPTNQIEGDNQMENEEVKETQVNLTTLERIFELFRSGSKPEDVMEVEDNASESQEDFEALAAEARGKVDELTAKINKMEADALHAERVSHFASELGNEAGEVHELLAGLSEEQANLIVKRFSALYAQAKGKVDEFVGGTGAEDDSGNTVATLNRLILAKVESGKTYAEAFSAVQIENPTVFAEYVKGAVK
jgi:hypothetical protein